MELKLEVVMQALKTPAQVNFSPLLRRYTLEEFWALPAPEDRSHYDLIGGYLFMVPPPNPPHGDIAARLTKSIIKHLLIHQIDGDVHHPPEAIYRSTEHATYLEPDMLYVSRELRARMGDKRSSADIVFEYLSPSTATYDCTTKADTYLALGVRELWLVDPSAATIEVRFASTGASSPVWESWRYSTGHHAESRVLPGWKVSVDELFEGLV
jgi:Uma2 family endonuclease